MNRVAIGSRTIRSVGYDQSKGILEIEFNDGSVSQFLQVPSSVHNELMSAKSKTDYYRASIALNYRFRRVWRNLEELLLAVADVLVLEERPVAVNERAHDGDTPLHTAAVWGDVRAIEMLVQAGAVIDARGDLGTTPLYNAVAQGHVDATRRLLEFGADPDVRNELGVTPLERASESGDLAMKELFAGD